MRKLIFVLFALCSVIRSYSQFSVGAKAGINISKETYSNKAIYSTNSHSFFCGGLFGNYSLSKNFALELSLLYSAEGTGESYMANEEKVTGVVTITRFNIPVMAQYKTPVGIYLETGPQLGLVLSAKGKYSNNSETYDFKKNTQSVLFSWCVGAGYQLTRGVPGLGIEAVYAPGLSDVNEGEVNGQTIRASTFSIRLLYSFALGK